MLIAPCSILTLEYGTELFIGSNIYFLDQGYKLLEYLDTKFVLTNYLLTILVTIIRLNELQIIIRKITIIFYLFDLIYLMIRNLPLGLPIFLVNDSFSCLLLHSKCEPFNVLQNSFSRNFLDRNSSLLFKLNGI